MARWVERLALALARLLLVGTQGALPACGGGGGGRPFAHVQTTLADCARISECVARCDQGRGASCYAAGAMYETGSGAAQSYADAARLYSKACDAGESRGCNDLGVISEIGLAGAPDCAAAARLYGRACDGGDAEGCANLALRYDEGVGVPRDEARARELRRTACSLGVTHACRPGQ